MGLGVAIRNHIGQCVAACSKLHEEVTTPKVAEALAMRRALSIAGEEGFSKIMVVSDCLSLIQRVLPPGVDRNSVGLLESWCRTSKLLLKTSKYLLSAMFTVSLMNRHIF
jgi:hypothetical protein